MEMGTIIATKDIEEEGPCGNGDTDASRESGEGKFGAGESGRVREYMEHGKAVREVHQAPDTVCGVWGWSLMQELLGKTLWVFACACEGGGRWQRWAIGVAAGKGGGQELDKKEGEEASYPR